ARWARAPDLWTRWNVASAFTSAEARRHAEAALPVLRRLAADERPMVARAVVRALANLAVEDRARVLRAVGAWGEDAPRRAAASALKARLLGRSM
ncbi:MAG TPA: HEAT repeat domain-containing protein, partial [Anaeromyxobacter sp.]